MCHTFRRQLQPAGQTCLVLHASLISGAGVLDTLQYMLLNCFPARVLGVTDERQHGVLQELSQSTYLQHSLVLVTLQAHV